MNRNRKGILLIEDDVLIRETLMDLLTAEGYIVVSKVNGNEALEYLKSQPKFCLILLDLMMPVLGGVEFMKLLKRDFPEYSTIPILIISAAGDLAERASQGTAGLIKKPIDLEILLEMIKVNCSA